jgi:uncharacterized SAM-binding protein YcdF (DUF218 family)
MFFVLSKTVTYLTQPLVIVCICFAISFLVRTEKWKKRMRWITLGLLLVFTNDFLTNAIMRGWEPEPIPYASIQQTYDFGIVLAGVTIAEIEPNDRVYFQRGADRVIHAVQLYKLGKVRKLLVTGGSGRLIDIGEREADDIKQAMVLMGVPEADIWVEADSRNTHESAVAVQELLTSKGITGANHLLITSAFHMPRSERCFRKVGLAITPFPADFYSHPTKFHPDVLFVPKVGALNNWHILVKEWLGILAYWVAGYI